MNSGKVILIDGGYRLANIVLPDLIHILCITDAFILQDQYHSGQPFLWKWVWGNVTSSRP